jgi:hypothetical protein
MFVSVHHVIHDIPAFQQRGEGLIATPPDGVRPQQFYPATDFSRAVCLWEGPSAAAVREYIDGTLGDASTQDYFEVAEEHTIGLPATQVT